MDWEYLVSMYQGRVPVMSELFLILADGFFFSDPGAGDSASANGMISLSFGRLFEKVKLFLTRILNISLIMSTGSHTWYRSMQCQSLQPPTTRLDYCWKGNTEFCSLT